MEPKLSDTNVSYHLPDEPSLTPFGEQKSDIPKIVPADFKAPPRVVPKQDAGAVKPAAANPAPAPAAPQVAAQQSAAPSNTSGTTYSANDPRALMASLSKDISELSQPRKKEEAPVTPSEPEIGVKGADGIMYPPEDDLGDPEVPPSSSGFFRSVMLLVCLCCVIVAAWQVTLFLQPEILQKEPFNSISEKSCDYLYCPPLRTPVILKSGVDAEGPNKWMLSMQIQNQDMRSQKLPNLQLTLEGTDGAKTQKIFEPREYKVVSGEKAIKGGGTIEIQVPFDYTESRPKSFRVKVLED